MCSSNLPPDWRGEPPDHDERCRTNCPYEIDDLLGECMDGHDTHCCTCDELHEADMEALAEAWADRDVEGGAV
jgi:hypothetical protein